MERANRFMNVIIGLCNMRCRISLRQLQGIGVALCLQLCDSRTQTGCRAVNILLRHKRWHHLRIGRAQRSNLGIMCFGICVDINEWTLRCVKIVAHFFHQLCCCFAHVLPPTGESPPLLRAGRVAGHASYAYPSMDGAGRMPIMARAAATI